MKTGRNEPCPCGSGKKYKHCCMNSREKVSASMLDDIEQIVAMNPDLTIEEINAIMQHKMRNTNAKPIDDFCGLTPDQMNQWLYAPLNEVKELRLNIPSDLSTSPVMRYLELIITEAMANGGSIKTTSKGNLPAKLVKQASELYPQFAVSKHDSPPSFCEFMGNNEDKFNALHYTRILAELSGIVYRRSGRFHVKKSAQTQWLKQGLRAFFLPMLETAIKRFNWAYFDRFEATSDVQLFSVFMLWRLQTHGSLAQLNNEVCLAFPDILRTLPQDSYAPPKEMLGFVIKTRFIRRLLEFWGFIVAPPSLFHEPEDERQLELQPLFHETFKFHSRL